MDNRANIYVTRRKNDGNYQRVAGENYDMRDLIAFPYKFKELAEKIKKAQIEKGVPPPECFSEWQIRAAFDSMEEGSIEMTYGKWTYYLCVSMGIEA